MRNLLTRALNRAGTVKTRNSTGPHRQAQGRAEARRTSAKQAKPEVIAAVSRRRSRATANSCRKTCRAHWQHSRQHSTQPTRRKMTLQRLKRRKLMLRPNAQEAPAAATAPEAAPAPAPVATAAPAAAPLPSPIALANCAASQLRRVKVLRHRNRGRRRQPIWRAKNRCRIRASPKRFCRRTRSTPIGSACAAAATPTSMLGAADVVPEPAPARAGIRRGARPQARRLLRQPTLSSATCPADVAQASEAIAATSAATTSTAH